MLSPTLLLLLIVSFLIGAVPFAVVVARGIRGVNIQRSGSGNAGAMNTFRSVGPVAGVLVALLDGAKAALAMYLGLRVLGPEAAALCGAATVAGHCFSPFLIFASRRERGSGWKLWLRRSGGKGLASGMAVLLLIDWRLALIIIAIFFVALLLLRKDETWPSMIAVASTTPLVWWWTRAEALTVAVLLVSIVVIVKHLPDVREGFFVDQPT
ncbi:MAG TPA: glycerol-3-phosphate acyltransferase [Herpetosiphonaceae bacterium]